MKLCMLMIALIVASVTSTSPNARAQVVPLSPPGEAAQVTAEVVYTDVDAQDRSFRFVARLTNHSPLPATGIKTRWDVMDASGAIVGSRSTPHPDLSGGASFHYVGGAGSIWLSGTPASIAVVVEDPGRQTNSPSRHFLTVESPTATPGSDRGEWTVSAVVINGAEPLARAKLAVSSVFFAADGRIVGADFDTAPTGVPDVIQPGARLKIEYRANRVGQSPAAVEVIAVIRS